MAETKYPTINGKEFGWADIQFAFLGRPVTGITEIKYGAKRDRKFIYAVGDKPVAYANGQEESNGSITMLQSEFESIVRAAKAAGKTPTSLPPFPIIVQYLDDANLMVKDIIHSVLTLEWEKASKQGDLNMTVTVPFTCSHIELQAD
ncbi:hypothetical protein [Hymenobacter glacieicola]|uniref:DUF4279 domain-containing protein n=1 Tax=Hymenobacter glacieicola TaxID=1562124 RepID=A0ABQ1WMF8_9BACT|nr:hypothetical protein [Hymenobacter glacieicola]GGG33387.1 hypothetical protein GCM10011378_07330 [Hymenobacter glacieicola]